MPPCVFNEQLIALVAARPTLWNQKLDSYKNRAETKKAWNEVFSELNNEFDIIDDEQKTAYGKEVIKKWNNIRDAFKKSQRKHKSKSAKPYLYTPKLQFLKAHIRDNKKTKRRKVSSLDTIIFPFSEDDNNVDEEDKATLFSKYDEEEEYTPKEEKVDIQMEILQPSQSSNTSIESTDRHLSFFNGIIPSLCTFNDDEIVDFQLMVVQAISYIKKRRNNKCTCINLASAY